MVSRKQRAQVNMYLVDKVVQFLWRGSIFGPVEVNDFPIFVDSKEITVKVSRREIGLRNFVALHLTEVRVELEGTSN